MRSLARSLFLCQSELINMSHPFESPFVHTMQISFLCNIYAMLNLVDYRSIRKHSTTQHSAMPCRTIYAFPYVVCIRLLLHNERLRNYNPNFIIIFNWNGNTCDHSFVRSFIWEPMAAAGRGEEQTSSQNSNACASHWNWADFEVVKSQRAEDIRIRICLLVCWFVCLG